MSRAIELLSPAKDLECGIAAVDHGADAVYIGATHFGARAAAGNSIEDIKSLVDYAHQYDVKVYVTVNTIIYDDEIEKTCQLIRSLYDIRVDAILVQDMAVFEMDIPPIALHASTQMDNRTPEKVKWLLDKGFRQTVLARELSLQEISDIHRAVPEMKLESFVHGALCVSYSGQCYASQYCFGRSANRGECAQFCRLRFNLEDSDGVIIEKDKYLLSLKDMCRIDRLEDMLAAGVTSFKIEGRLKDSCYVKNVTAAYSERLNAFISRHPGEYHRSSIGHSSYSFAPSLAKSFNRSFTDYLIDGRLPYVMKQDKIFISPKERIWNFNTPKAVGEPVGRVKEVTARYIVVSGITTFQNGDGLCFVDDKGKLQGFRVNRVDNNRIYVFGDMPSGLKRDTGLFRNNDQQFEKLLSQKSAERKMNIAMTFSETESGYMLSAELTENTFVHISASVTMEEEKQTARTSQSENMERQLTKLGNTPFTCSVFKSTLEKDYFIPSSKLNEIRRELVIELQRVVSEQCNLNSGIPQASLMNQGKQENQAPPSYRYKYQYNISNELARNFYVKQGVEIDTEAFELKKPSNPMIMQCKHCLRYALGRCVKNGGIKPEWKEPLFLTLPDGGRFKLDFDCKHCQMNIYGQ